MLKYKFNLIANSISRKNLLNLNIRFLHTPLLEYKLKTSHQSQDLKLRCTEFDRNGGVKEISREFSKAEICNKHSLQPRDLRKIDSTYLNQMPGILVREKAILVNMLHIKAIVKADSVVVFDSFGSVNSLNQSLFIYDLQERLRSKSSYSMATPLEFRALEAILVSVASSLNQEMETTVQTVTSLLIQLEDDINRELLKRLLDVSKKLAHFDQKVLTIRRAIIEVLDQDEDLAAMYLTSKLKGEPRSIHQHEEIEMLLETYCKQIEEIANIISQLSNNVKSTEDIVNIILDSQRNSLLLLELRVAILTLGLTFSSLIAALFGMNLKNYFELDDFMFYIVTLSAFLTSAIITKTFLRRMNLLLKLHK